jgi:butyryl-CoA dehydrogenase
MSYEEELDSTGQLSSAARAAITARVRGSGLAAINMPMEWGGAGLGFIDQVLVTEQLGRLTNSLWSLVWKPATVLRHCTPEQRERYLLPAIEGSLADAYSVTEPFAGSDVRAIATTAVEVDGGYRINGEKWFATRSESADVIILLARVQPGDHFTLFLIERDWPGRRILHTPRMAAPSPEEHPQVLYEDLYAPRDAVLGEVGAGLEIIRELFLDERLYVAARCVGGAERALELTSQWARERVQGGKALLDHQLVQGAIADCAVEIALNRALVYQVACEADDGVDRKLLHAKAAMVKYAASEAAGRILDRCVQLYGGRGQTREFEIERLSRSLRAERIWEGTSDIQRLIVANHVHKRGLAGLLSPFAPLASLEQTTELVQKL